MRGVGPILAAGAMAMTLSLGACASVVRGDKAVTGHLLDEAVNLYGPWSEQTMLNNRDVYIWRRKITDPDTKVDYVCELRATLGFRQIIRSTVIEGVPQVCEQFSVRYKSDVK